MTADTPSRLPPRYRIVHAVSGPLLKWLGLSCRRAVELSSEQMDRDLSKRESFQLRVHLMICEVCRHLPAQFQGLRKLLIACEHPPEDLPTEVMSEHARLRIIDHLNNMNTRP